MGYKKKFENTRVLIETDLVRITNNPYEGSQKTVNTLKNILSYMNKLDKKHGKKEKHSDV